MKNINFPPGYKTLNIVLYFVVVLVICIISIYLLYNIDKDQSFKEMIYETEYSYGERDMEENPNILNILLIVPALLLFFIIKSFDDCFVNYTDHFTRNIILLIIVSIILTNILIKILDFSDFVSLFIVNFVFFISLSMFLIKINRLLRIKNNRKLFNFTSEDIINITTKIESLELNEYSDYCPSISDKCLFLTPGYDFSYDIDYLTYLFNKCPKKNDFSLQKYFKYVVIIDRKCKFNINSPVKYNDYVGIVAFYFMGGYDHKKGYYGRAVFNTDKTEKNIFNNYEYGNIDKQILYSLKYPKQRHLTVEGINKYN